MTKTEDLLLREFERLTKTRNGMPFDYFPTQAINAGICRTREEYYNALYCLLDAGAVVKVGKREREGYYTTNLYVVPNTEYKQLQIPEEVKATTIQPFDFITLLETKTTMCEEQVDPYSDIFYNVERGTRQERGVKEYFNTNPVTVTGSTFNDFMTANTKIVGESNNTYGKEYTTAYLLMWWLFQKPSPEVAPAPSLEICP